MFKKLFITIALLGAFSSSAFAWSETFDVSDSGSPYNAFQVIMKAGGSISFGSTATAAGWQVVQTQISGDYVIINAVGPISGEVDSVTFSGPGSESGAFFVWQKWYISPSTQELKINYYIDKVYNSGDYNLTGHSGWYITKLSNSYGDNWYGPTSAATKTVRDGGVTLVLLGLALFGMLLFTRFSSRSH